MGESREGGFQPNRVQLLTFSESFWTKAHLGHPLFSHKADNGSTEKKKKKSRCPGRRNSLLRLGRCGLAG